MDLDTFESIKRKLNLSTMSKPALIGVAAVLALVAVVIVGRLIGAATTTDFQIMKGGGQQAHAQIEQTVSGESQDSEEARTIFVHVTGAVNNPGLCELEEGARVYDAVQACGGFAEDASPESINLARSLSDGEQVNVATCEEVAQLGAGGTQSSTSVQGSLQGSTGNALTSSHLVNINTADAVELTTLPGIGEATAAKIVSDRQANGAFKDVNDLKRVAGIGDKKLEGLRDLICV